MNMDITFQNLNSFMILFLGFSYTYSLFLCIFFCKQDPLWFIGDWNQNMDYCCTIKMHKPAEWTSFKG
jgi:hypothetical protein